MNDIRWVIRQDMPEILQIEKYNFSLDWNEEDFLRVLRRRNCIGMVWDKADKIYGFIVYELYKHKLCVLNMAVDKNHQRQGIGREIMEAVINKLSAHRRTRLTCEVRETNLTAQLFLKSLGFKATRVIRNFYKDFNEDAYHMQYRLNEKASVACEESY